MKLLALDQSSRITGWAVFDDNNLVDSGTFTCTNDNFGQRFVDIANTVFILIQTYGIDEVAIEDI